MTTRNGPVLKAVDARHWPSVERADSRLMAAGYIDRREYHMPDVALMVRGLAETGETEHLEKVLGRLGFVEEVNVDQEKGLVAVSYEGGETELGRIGEAIQDAGYEFEFSPGAGEVAGD